MIYNFTEIEAKWQRIWQEKQTFRTVLDKQKKKYYCLEMFPYPSGSGLHVGLSVCASPSPSAGRGSATRARGSVLPRPPT